MLNLKYLEQYQLPSYIKARFQKDASDKFKIIIDDESADMCCAALIDFFLATISTRKPCGMPSTLVDELWHTFLLFTKDYRTFCNDVGRFIDHIPDVDKNDKPSKEKMELATLRTFIFCCEREGIPLNSTEIPILFSIDSLLPQAHICDPEHMWDLISKSKILESI